MIERETLRETFRKQYGREPRLFRAPGRVNLIGEHTDYNDGFVLPMALDRETVVAAALRDDRKVRVISSNVNQRAEFDLDAPGEKRRGVWLDYVEGVARMIEQRTGARLRGADVMITSTVPAGAGLSSSAALEISTGLAFIMLSEIDMDRRQLALAGQQAEHEYVGTMCGIMDQFIATLGRKGHALLIDCRTLDATHIPLDATETVVAVCDTNVKHELSSSEYNKRRAECEEAVGILRREMPDIRALRDVSVEDFERLKEMLPEVVRRRCRHVVTENARTLTAAAALQRGALEEMGQLMALSHESLRYDYEVSCAELDHLVEIASRLDGVLGARMTGGGFGGSTVNFVRRDALEEFKKRVTAEYRERTGLETSIYISEPRDGASELS